MKRALKITAWTLFGILMTILVAFGIACYILFTPARLTPIVNRIAGNYITCPYEIGPVHLTFFSTFPRVGVRIDGLTVVNPMEGAQNDTVLSAGQVTASVNLRQLLRHNELIVPEAVLEDATVHYYIAKDGKTNLDIFASSTDTVPEEDTTAFALPFKALEVDGLRIKANHISYKDAQSGATYAELNDVLLEARAANWNEMNLHLQTSDLFACLSNESYADHVRFEFESPLRLKLDSMHFGFDKAKIALNEFAMTLDGDIALGDSIDMDLHLATTGAWKIEPLLRILPQAWVESIQQYQPQGDLALQTGVKGVISDTQMPVVTIDRLDANLWNSSVGIQGTVSNIQSDMLIDMQMALDAKIPDFEQFIPDDMTIQGSMKGTVNAQIRMSDLEKGVLTQGQMDLTTNRLTVTMDTTLDAELGVSAISLKGKQILSDKAVYQLTLTTDRLDGQFDDNKAVLDEAHLDVSLVGGKKIKAKLSADNFDGRMGAETTGRTQALKLEAAAKYNKNGENFLLTWNPRVGIHLKDGVFNAPDILPDILYVPSIDFTYSNHAMTIEDSRIELGNSDLNIHGDVQNIGQWFRHEGILEGTLDITSDHCDANQLLAWMSDDNGSEEPEPEDKTEVTNDSVITEPNPFLVPTDVNLALNTHIREVDIFNQNAKNLKGGIYLQEGSLILDEVGFVCRAAKLQLTAMYRSPRKNHLYLGFDYHMIDVDIDELLSMIPNLETMVPMLSSFKGQAEFHLAAETYLKSNYEPKMSTLRGAASLTGKDLVVLDGETFDKISKLLLFSKKTENKIDSLNAEITVYKNEIDVYPLCVQMDNYMVALGGRHNTNMTFNYDINVLRPIYLGVNVSGNIDDLQIKLAKCKFAQDFKPHWYQKVDNQSRELRERIKQSMERNVRIK